jgi:hypothetical protein
MPATTKPICTSSGTVLTLHKRLREATGAADKFADLQADIWTQDLMKTKLESHLHNSDVR